MISKLDISFPQSHCIHVCAHILTGILSF